MQSIPHKKQGYHQSLLTAAAPFFGATDGVL